MKAALKAALRSLSSNASSKAIKDPCYRESSAATMVYIQRPGGFLRAFCGCASSNSCTASFIADTYLELPLSRLQLSRLFPATPDQEMPSVNHSISFVTITSDQHRRPAEYDDDREPSFTTSHQHTAYTDVTSGASFLEPSDGSSEFLEYEPVYGSPLLRRCDALPARQVPSEGLASGAAITLSKQSSRRSSYHTSSTWEAVLAEERAADNAWRQHEAFRLTWQLATLQQQWSESESGLQRHEFELRHRLENVSALSGVTGHSSQQQSRVPPAAQTVSVEDWQLFVEAPDLCLGSITC